MLLTDLAAWASLGWLIVGVPPSRPFARVAFYLLAFAGMTGAAALAAWLVLGRQRGIGRHRSPADYLGHAMLLAAIVSFALWLQSLRMLTALVALLLVGLYVFLELALLFGTRGAVELDVPSRTYGAMQRAGPR